MYIQMTHPTEFRLEIGIGRRYYVGYECQVYDCAVYQKISNEIHFFDIRFFKAVSKLPNPRMRRH